MNTHNKTPNQSGKSATKKPAIKKTPQKHKPAAKKKKDGFTISFFADNSIRNQSKTQKKGRIPSNYRHIAEWNLCDSETQIKQHWNSFMWAGMLFNHIRKYRLYLLTHASFEDYFHDILGKLDDEAYNEEQKKASTNTDAPSTPANEQAAQELAEHK